MPGSVSKRSVSSYSSAPSRDSAVSRLENVGQSDLLSFSESIDNALFGVLFTIVKERYNTGLRFLLVKLALDFIQLFAMVFKPADGWVFDQDLWLWKWVRYLRFADLLAPRGYAVFLAALYTTIGLMMVAVALSAWVAWCFRHRSFPAVWPIKLLRVYANIFFQTLDVATLTLLQLPFDCRWLGYPKELRNTFSVFPSVVCTDMPHVIHMAVAGVALMLYLAMALTNLMADFELNPTTRNLYATANSTVEVRAFFLKFLMTVCTYGIGWTRVQNVFLLLLALYHTWMYLKWEPHLFAWVNHLRVGLNLSICAVALGGVVLVFHDEADERFFTRTTNVTLGLLAPFLILGGAVSYMRLEWWSKLVQTRYRNAAPGLKARRIYKFLDPKEVEIAARVCRKWTDQHFEVLDRQAAKEAEIIIKAGMQIFPNNAYVLILYSNLLIDVMESTQTGYSQLQAAKKCNPNIMERFAIFVREQEHMQRSAGAKSGESSVDLVSYVEYQRNHKLVMRAHRNALVAIRSFWQLLLHNQVSFTSLSKALMRIEKSVNVAEGIYKTTLQRYPASPKLMRGYGKFLEAVKNNPWKAATYFSEADKLREQQEQDEATMAVMGMEDGEPGGNNLLHRVDERINVVFIINSAGIIQTANKNACSLLGYGKGELDGKNINIIMPPPFSQRHNRYIRQYIQTGRDVVLSSVNMVVALHKARYVLPVKLAVSKVSGATEDSVFMGVLEPVAVDPNEAHLYLLPNGVVTAMDLPFHEWLGHELGDIIGKDVGVLLQEAEGVRTALTTFDTSAAAKRTREGTQSGYGAGAAGGLSSKSLGLPSSPTAAAGQNSNHGSAALGPGQVLTEHVASVFFLHKYSQPVECSATLQRHGIGMECMVEMTLRRVGPPQMLVLTGASGRIKYVSSELARALGTAPSALLRQPLGDIMPQPWGTLHEAWIRSHSSQAGPAQFMAPPGSCRTGMAMVLGASHRIQGYYRMAITTLDESDDGGTDSAQHVVEVHPSSREEALADRRLVLTVDADGIVTEVDDGPEWLFGFSPAQLLGRSLADCVATLRPTGRRAGGGQEKEEEEVPVADLLAMLITKVMQHGGCSWRVGVTPPMDEVELAALGPMRDAVMAKRTVAAVMEIEASLDTDAIRAVGGGAQDVLPAGSTAVAGRAPDACGPGGPAVGSMPATTNGMSAGSQNAPWLKPTAGASGVPPGPPSPAAVGGGAQRRLSIMTPKARRSSWLAMEAPGGGIMVVSGSSRPAATRRASSVMSQPYPGSVGDMAAGAAASVAASPPVLEGCAGPEQEGAAANVGGCMAADYDAIRFATRRQPRAVRMRQSATNEDLVAGLTAEVAGAAGSGTDDAGGGAQGAREASTREGAGDLSPRDLGPEASALLETLAPPAYRRSVGSSSSAGSRGNPMGADMDAPGSEGAAEPTAARSGTPTPRPFTPDAPAETLKLPVTALQQEWLPEESEPADGQTATRSQPGPLGESTEQPSGLGRPPTFPASVANAAAHALSRPDSTSLLDINPEALLLGSIMSARNAQHGPGAGPLLPGGGAHVDPSMLLTRVTASPGSTETGMGNKGRRLGLRGSGHGTAGPASQTGVQQGQQHQGQAGDDGLADADDEARVVVLRVSLWRTDLMTTVAEVDGNNTIMSFVGDEVAPPGLVFGVPTSSLVSASLPSLLDLPDRSVAGLFHDPGTARRGGLKTTAKQSNKVGALRQVCGRHSDGYPLHLSMQAVVRESAPNRTYVVLKPREPHMGSREALLASVQAQRNMMMEDQQPAPGTDGTWPGLDAQAGEGGRDAMHAGVRGLPPPSPKARASSQVRNAASLRRSLDSNHSGAGASLRQLSSLDMDGVGEPGKVKAAADLAPIELSPVFGDQAEGVALVHMPPANNDVHVTASGFVTPPFILSTENSDPKSTLWATDPGELPQRGAELHDRLRQLPGNDGRQAASEPHPFAVADSGARMQLGGRMHGNLPSLGVIRTIKEEGLREGSSGGMRNALSPRVGRPGGGQYGGIGSSTRKMLAVPPPAVVDKLGDVWDGKGLINNLTELSGASSESEGRRRSSGGARLESSDDSDGDGRGHSSHRPLRPQSSASRRGGTAPDSAAGSKGRRASALGLATGFVRHSSGDQDSQAQTTPSIRRALSRESQPRSRRSSAVRRVQGPDPAAGGGDAGGYDTAAFAAGMERLSHGQEAAERDDDGGSETSGVSGVSEGLDASLPQTDYRRGKRYRKLLKVLSSPSVQRAATDFQWQALLANVAQLLTNLVAFVLLTVLLHREIRNLDTITHGGQAIRRAHEMFIRMQKLNNIYEGMFPTLGYYKAEDVGVLSADLLARIDDFARLHTSLYAGVGNQRPDLTLPYNPDSEQDVWNKPVRNETAFYGVQPYRVEYANTSLWDLGNRFIERAQEVQHTHDEWGPAHGTLSDMDAYRYCMTNGPLSLYEGYIDAMHGMTRDAVEASNGVNQLQLVMLVVQGGAVCVLLLLYMWWLQRRVSQQRYGMYSLFMILPVGLLRALASKSVTVMDDSEAEESSDDDHEDKNPPPRNDHQSDISQQHQQPIHLMPPPKLSQSGSSKAPKRTLSNLFKSRSRSGSAAKHRHLVPSNHESISLLTPFVVWGVLICVLYAVGYALLADVEMPLSLLSAQSSTVVRMHRLMLYSLRVGSEATDEGKAMLQPVLQHELREFEREWHVLLYGANSTWQQDPRFQLCKSGVVFSDATLTSQIFRFAGCIVDLAAGPEKIGGEAVGSCLLPDNMFYAATTRGTNAMVERLMEDVAYLTRLPPANISINSTHLDYIMSEGEGNVEVGMDDIADSLLAEIRRLYALVSNLQICSLVLSWLLAVAFIFLQLRPFIARNRTETHRIARMLSELPADVDVEGMVTRMLLRDGDGRVSGRHGSRGDGSQGSATGMTGRGGGEGASGGVGKSQVMAHSASGAKVLSSAWRALGTKKGV